MKMRNSVSVTNKSLKTPVSVIILNWNGAKLLEEFLPSVIRHTPVGIGHIIVADNGSTDNSIEVLRRRFPEVEIMAFDRNYGFAEGYNLAIAKVDSPYVVLLNSDVAVKEDWLSPMYRFMESNPEFGAIQPKILSYKEPNFFEYAGAMGGYLDKNGYPYCRGRIFSTIEEDNGQYDLRENKAYETDWASGAALMVRRECYISAGGLDSSFFAHMEEIDLCWRIRLLGFKIGALPSSRIFHLGGGSLPASNPRKTYLNFRNNLLMLHKNLPATQRTSALFRRRLLDTVAWLKFVATFDWANAKAIFLAHRDYASMNKNLKSSEADRNLLSDKSNILISYFVSRKRTFSEL